MIIKCKKGNIEIIKGGLEDTYIKYPNGEFVIWGNNLIQIYHYTSKGRKKKFTIKQIKSKIIKSLIKTLGGEIKNERTWIIRSRS